jgi:AcrR family transcriptional regulator
MTSKATPASRPPLTKDRILGAAVDLVDRSGLEALTMRRLGSELGFEAMSLYKHVANKDEILDGMVELVVSRIEIPEEGSEWRNAMRRRAVSAREVLGRHSWAIGLLESRGFQGPAAMRYIDAILGNLTSSGFSIETAAHAFWLLDCYVYGQVIQETSMTPSTPEDPAESPPPAPEQTTMKEYPHLIAMYQHAQTFGYTFDGEFEFGLELILDGLERHRST